MRIVVSLACWILISVTGMSQSIKAITFNIRYANESDGNNKWSLRTGIVNDFIAYEAPDFLGLQEALISQIRDIASAQEGFKWIGKGRDDGKEAGEFSPLFYNATRWKLVDSGTFWLSETPDVPSKSWDAALPRVCTWAKFESIQDQSIVYVFNTHFDHIGELARQNAAALIVKQIEEKAGSQKTILMGDFNAEVSSQTIQTVLKSPLVDSFDQAVVKLGQEGTFNGFDYQSIPTRRIDYLFVSQDFMVRKYGVDSRVIDGRYLSDHFPVIIDLTLKN